MAKTRKSRIVRMRKSRVRRNRSVKRRTMGGGDDGVIYYNILNNSYRTRTNQTGWTEWQTGNPINKDDGYYMETAKTIYKHTGKGL